MKIKHHNVFQIVLDDKIVNNIYASLFFSSHIGASIRQSLMSDSVIPNISKKNINDLEIPVPPLNQQEIIRYYFAKEVPVLDTTHL